jgi:hypothetical protein
MNISNNINSPEIIELGGVRDSPTIILNKDSGSHNYEADRISQSSKKSVNFGDGIELLMNEKRKGDGSKSPSNDVNLGDVNDLENELNNLSSNLNDIQSNKGKSSLFNQAINNVLNLNPAADNNIGDGGGEDAEKSSLPSVKFDLNLNNSSDNNNIGKATAEGMESNKTWDGFNKFKDIPMDPDKNIKVEPQMTREDLLKEKFNYLRKLEDLERKGASLSKKYNMDSPLNEMQGEYETIIAEKEKNNSLKFQGRMLMAAITGLEFLNNRFDPFDIKIDGWSEQINENINEYDEIFGELHEKYKSKAKMAPELKLLFQLGGSAVMVHMTNTMFKSSMPGMDDIMRQNPELMQQFTSAAVNSMGDTNPGFGGFMNDIMGNQGGHHPPQQSQPQPPRGMRPPPPIPTQQHMNTPNRPDIMRGRGGPEPGINMDSSYERANGPEKSTRRPDMKGPSDITDILSGLKTKSINISQPQEQKSTVSIQELKELSNQKIPKSTKRGRSEKNTISLDI